MIVFDQDGKEFELQQNKLRKLNGTRYATRASIAKVLQGKQRFVIAGSSHPNAKKRWGAVATKTKLRIGCRKFYGEAFKRISTWAC